MLRLTGLVFRLIASLAFMGLISSAHAQSSYYTNPVPTLITAGLTFQQLMAAGEKRSITIQNNNASDACNILVGGPWQIGDTTTTTRSVNAVTLTGAKASITLAAGQSYTRYYSYIPKDQILVTCAATGDSVYADYQ